MKNIYANILTATLLCAAGCATAPRVALLEQVGPGPAPASPNPREGYLQVYSARERAPRDVNAEEFAWNNDFGKNEFLHGIAHTSYSIYAPDGQLLQQVRNTAGMNDAQPTLVRLAPGVYRVKAESEDYNDVTLTVMVPVCVKPGKTTSVHLDGNWNPPGSAKGNQLVLLPNGHIVGWLSPGSDDSEYASRTDG